MSVSYPAQERAARAAAPRFGIDVAEISLLSRSENVVFEVRDRSGQRFVSRLHRPGYNTIEQLRSEVAFVESLRAFGIPTPVAVAADTGYYVEVDVDGVAHQVGAIEWVEGVPVGAAVGGEGSHGDAVVAHYRTIGTLAATIRQHAESWNEPASFDRRRWDADGLMGESPLWGRFWEVDELSRSQQALFAEARTELHRRLSALPLDRSRFGVIHADLHLGNLMAADDDQLTVIDFDDAGYAWYPHELAVSLHGLLDQPFFNDAQAALVEGHRTVHPLSAEEERLIDTFLVVRALMIIGWLDTRRDLPHFEHFDMLAEQAERTIAGFL